MEAAEDLSKLFCTWAADYTWCFSVFRVRGKKHRFSGAGWAGGRAASITPIDKLCKLGMIHVPGAIPPPTPRRLGVRNSAGLSGFINRSLVEGMLVGGCPPILG